MALPTRNFLLMLLLAALAFVEGKGINQTCDSKNATSCAAITKANCSADSRCVCVAETGLVNATFCGPLIDNKCDGTNTCYTRNSTCVEEKCKCPAGLTHNSNRTFCYPKPEKFGDLCGNDTECKFSGEQGECKDGHCSRNETSDPAPGKFGHLCASDAECKLSGEQGVCKEGQCSLKETSTPAPGKIGDPCANDAECKFPGEQGVCKDGHCSRNDTSAPGGKDGANHIPPKPKENIDDSVIVSDGASADSSRSAILFFAALTVAVFSRKR